MILEATSAVRHLWAGGTKLSLYTDWHAELELTPRTSSSLPIPTLSSEHDYTFGITTGTLGTRHSPDTDCGLVLVLLLEQNWSLLGHREYHIPTFPP